jgi:hypothetical protein
MSATDSAKSRWWHDAGNQHVIRAVGAAVPVACVNATAFIGQFSFVHDHVKWILAGQVLFAGTLETVAVYLAWQAHLAKKADDTSMRITLGAYLFAAVVGVMNYSHFANHWHPTFMAVAMAAMSVMSPALWGVHTRRTSRDELKAKGLIEDHAVRLGGTRWTWHPFRSARVMNWATWHGINNPKRAIAHFARRYGAPADLVQDLARSLAREERAMLAQILLAQDDGTPESAPASAPETVPAGESAPLPEGSAPFMTVPAPGDRASNPVAQEAVMVIEPPVLNGEAHLEADASLSGGKPSQEVIDQAELTLMGMALEELPSERAVARDLLGDPGQRRLAKRLLSARKATGTSFTGDPAGGSPNGSQAPGMIAPARGFQPGGANG